VLIHDLLENAARRWPTKVALIAGERRLTYRELDGAADRLAHGLVDRGVEAGDRIAIQLDNNADAVTALFAAVKAGAVFVMINPGTRPGKLTTLLRDSGARVLIASEKTAAPAAHLLSELPRPPTVIRTGPELDDLRAPSGAAVTGPPPGRRAGEGDLAALLYTSGTTGDAKGVMLTHGNVVSAIASIVSYLGLVHDDVLLDVLPLSFGYGLTQLFSAFQVGAQLVLERGMVFPTITLRRIADEKVTRWGIVPTIAAVLLAMDLGRHDLSSLRTITNAGAALPDDHLRRLRAALPRVDLVCMYGQTECLRISYLDPAQVDARLGSVGKGMPNQDLTVVDEDGREVGPGEVGELVVSGPHVMRGYWQRPQESARKLRPGRVPGHTTLITGDLFRRDAEGFLYFVARKDDIIKCKGEKVSPREVENVLQALPGVVEAAVVGAQDAVLGQAVRAVVVLASGARLSARDVQRHCADHLEDFMVPSAVEFRDSLPKNENGKIIKKDL